MRKIILIITVIFLYEKQHECECRLTIKKYEMCKDYSNIPIKLYSEFIRSGSNIQLVNINISLEIPVGSNIQLDIKAQAKMMNKWRNIMHVKEKDACKAMPKYFGNMWYDAERKLNIQPGVCPLPKGEYCLKNYEIKFDEMTLRAVPKGQIKAKIVGKRKDEVVICLDVEVESLE